MQQENETKTSFSPEAMEFLTNLKKSAENYKLCVADAMMTAIDNLSDDGEDMGQQNVCEMLSLLNRILNILIV